MKIGIFTDELWPYYEVEPARSWTDNLDVSPEEAADWLRVQNEFKRVQAEIGELMREKEEKD